MKILFDEFDRLLEHKIKYFSMLENIYKDKNNYQKIYFKLLKCLLISDCKKIIKEDLEYGSKEWLNAISYFCSPYSIFLHNEEDSLLIEWEEDIFSITKEKLINILKNSDKKYLTVYFNMGISMWSQKMLEIEM